MFISKIKAALGIFLMCVGSGVYAQNFKVVLDPGHGGHDFGAVRGNYVEKKIVLDVALKVGDLLKRDKNIDVVFTRKTDVFLEVRERTEIANKEKADVFISIHRSEEHTSELQSRPHLVCRLLLEKKKKKKKKNIN